MRNRSILSVSLALTLLPALAITAIAWGPSRPFRSSKADVLLRAQPFTAAGVYSGPLAGEIVLAGVPYRLATDVTVYEVGTGVRPPGTVVQDRYLTIMGIKTRNSTFVQSVIVRPVSEQDFSSSDNAANIHLMDQSAPR